MIPALSAEQEKDLLPAPHMGLGARLGKRVVNAPSSIINDMLRLGYNLGIKDPEQTEAEAVPEPYDIPAAQSFGETAVDFGVKAAEMAVPFTAASKVAKVASAGLELGPIASRALVEGAGFGVTGATESPDVGLEQAGIGASMGAASALLPGPMKILAAGGTGALTYLDQKHHGADNNQAGIMAGVNALLPMLSRGAKPKLPPATVAEEAAIAATPEATQPWTPPALLHGEPPPARPVAPLQLSDGFELLDGQQEFNLNGPEPITGRAPGQLNRISDDPMLPLRGPEGSLVRHPTYTEGEADALRKMMTPTPTAPEGSLVRDATYSPEEALLKSGAPPLPDTSFPISTEGVGQRVKPPGSLVRHPTFTEAEAETFRKSKEPVATSQPEPEPVSVLQPKAKVGSKIAGPVLLDAEGNILEQGVAGKDTHQTLMDRGKGKDNEIDYIMAMAEDKQHAFVSDTGTILDREQAGKLAFKAKQIDTPTSNLQSQHFLKGEGEGVKKVATLQPTPEGHAANVRKVAAEQKQPAAALSDPSPLETPPIEDMPHGLKPGDKARIWFMDSPEVATVMGKGEDGMIRVATKDGEELTLLPSDIEPLSRKNPKPPSVSAESVGGLTEVAEAADAEASKLPGGAKMKLSNFGEHGALDAETAIALGRYIAAPAVTGAAFFAADDQHRWQSAVAGMVAGGLLGHFGVKLLNAMKEAHVGETSLKAAIKDDVKQAVKAISGDAEMASRDMKNWNLSTNFDSVARWLQKNGMTYPAVVRMMDRSHGKIEMIGKQMRTSIEGLADHPQIASHRQELNKYFEGEIDFATLQKSAPKEIADAAGTITTARDALQKVLIEGLGESGLSTKIKDSLGKYMTTSYQLFHDKKYYPSDELIDKAAHSVAEMFPGESFAIRRENIERYLRDAKASQTMLGSKFAGGAAGESLGNVLGRYQKMTPEFKAMLGEHADPLIRMGMTASKLITGAKSAEFFNEIAAGVKANGLKYAYTSSERQSLLATLQHQIEKSSLTQAERVGLQAKLKDLDGYVPNVSGLAQGRLAGKHMDLTMLDQMANFENDAGQFSGMLGKSIAQATNSIKYGKIVLSPLQLVRQVVQLPILGMVARTNPTDWVKAFDVIRKPGSAEYQRLANLGVLSGDLVQGMLRKDMRSMMEGSLEARLNKRVAKGLHRWEEIWRTPDLVVRASAFMRKEAELLQKGIGAADAADQAIDHMNRYTMNYGAVPPIVAKGRQLPFINQYLSWTFETMRITKNIVQDAKKGDPYAIATLSAMALVPAGIQQMSENMLSDKDKKEWNLRKDQGVSYSKYNFKIVMGRQADGSFRYLDYTPLVIHDQVSKMVRAFAAGDMESVRQSNPVAGWENTPLLNIASVLVTGRDRLTGRKLDGIQQAKAIWNEAAPTIVGSELNKFQDALTPNNKGGYGITNTRTGKSNSISDLLLTYVTSVRPYTLKPEYVVRQAQAEAADRIRSQMITLNQIRNTDASDETKARALNNYQRAKEEIVKALQADLGLPTPEESRLALRGDGR